MTAHKLSHLILALLYADAGVVTFDEEKERGLFMCHQPVRGLLFSASLLQHHPV